MLDSIYVIAVEDGAEVTQFQPVPVDTAASLLTAITDETMTATELLSMCEPGEGARTVRADGRIIEVYRLTEGEAEEITQTI